MHALNVFLFRLIGISLFVNMNLYFPNADHPALILFCTSFSVLSFISIFWPRYLYSSTFSISVFSTIIFLFVLKFIMYLVFPLWIFRPIFLLSSFIIFNCSSIFLTVVVIRAISSANLSSERFSPSIFKPQVQVSTPSGTFSVLTSTHTSI